ncbi:helix-turn-helix domain-containing protein [Deinococcus pimensis]|uniref:helix-turn-helix domain-containing protein n=1 Tax=Deinococcus pimensis TaxID=309888 RepID=UPI001FE1F965|nr:helix-turn-helix transcriptional regulator [Deinococcus pimensis]
MNEQVRAAAKARMKERQLTQTELAKKTGLTQPALAKLLNGNVGRVPENWQRILDELGLELVAIPKE